MLVYIVKRLGQAVIAMFVVSLVVFLLIRMAPGDPAELMAPETASEEEIQALRVRLGLTRPLPVQFLLFLKDLLRMNLGTSFFYQQHINLEK